MKRTVAVAVHPQRSDAASVAGELAGWLSGMGVEVLMGWADDDDDSAAETAGPSRPEPPVTPDLVVAVGGDGTVLRAVRALRGAAVPVIGVNVGTLGYLTQVQPDGALSAVQAWLTGVEGDDWWLDERGLLEVTVRRSRGADGDAAPHLCLNEVVLDRHESGRTVRIRVDIDGQPFARYTADGVIVATPTGSTAYSLSARGPVLSPRVPAVLVTPVSPHMLFDRSLVLAWEEQVTLTVDAARPARIALDGIGLGLLEEGDVVVVGGSTSTARFVRTDRTPFHRVLRDKFGLGDQ